MSNEQKFCKVKIFQIKSMSNVLLCINQRCAINASGISCLALIQPEQYENDNPACKKAVAALQVAEHFKLYNFLWRLTQNDGLVVKVINRE